MNASFTSSSLVFLFYFLVKSLLHLYVSLSQRALLMLVLFIIYWFRINEAPNVLRANVANDLKRSGVTWPLPLR